MKNRAINAVIMIGFIFLISGCTTIHRIEISPLNKDTNTINETKLDSALVGYGFSKGKWDRKRIFFPAYRANQTLVGYWGKTHYHKNKKRGGTDIWVVMENQNLVVYIIGDYDAFDRTEEIIDGFSVRLPSLYPAANIYWSKQYFFDFR